MANLSDVALSCAIQLGRANANGTAILSLGTQIKEQIGEAIRHYNRKPWPITETYGLQLTTVSGQAEYDTLAASNGYGEQATALRSSVSPVDILDVVDFRNTNGDCVTEIPYSDYKRLSNDEPVNGYQTHYARYAGRLWLYPTPNAAYALSFSAKLKPLTPTSDTDTSVWFDQAQELIEAAANKRVCVKYLRDNERAAVFAEIERGIERDMHVEYIRKRATGKIRSHD